MADEMTTTNSGGPMANDAIQEAVDNLRQVMLDNDMDEGTVDALLHAATPNQISLVGNIADLNRLGALVADPDTDNSGALEAAIAEHIPPAPVIDGEPVTGASSPNAGNGNGDDLNAMTKAELQAKADEQGVDVPSGATKAELVAALGG
jgi:hypothetical protein